MAIAAPRTLVFSLWTLIHFIVKRIRFLGLRHELELGSVWHRDCLTISMTCSGAKDHVLHPE